jgi:cytochrome c oxidase subunit 4
MTMAHDEKHDAHGDDEIAHPLSPILLIGVFVALLGFTGLTVFCAHLGLGSQLSFTVAMVIATIKASMVMFVFMHLWWDKKFNVLAFVGSFLFVLLFIGMLLTDKGEYTPDIARKTADEAAAAGK